VDWLAHARATATLERERFLISRFVDKSQTEKSFIEAFLHPPLYSRAYKKGYGTLYTSVYRPLEKSLELLWPGGSWRHSFDNFDEGAYVTQFVDEDEFKNTRINRMPEIDHA